MLVGAPAKKEQVVTNMVRRLLHTRKLELDRIVVKSADYNVVSSGPASAVLGTKECSVVGQSWFGLRGTITGGGRYMELWFTEKQTDHVGITCKVRDLMRKQSPYQKWQSLILKDLVECYFSMGLTNHHR